LSIFVAWQGHRGDNLKWVLLTVSCCRLLPVFAVVWQTKAKTAIASTTLKLAIVKQRGWAQRLLLLVDDTCLRPNLFSLLHLAWSGRNKKISALMVCFEFGQSRLNLSLHDGQRSLLLFIRWVSQALCNTAIAAAEGKAKF
jgi:hypothetical protein